MGDERHFGGEIRPWLPARTRDTGPPAAMPARSVAKSARLPRSRPGPSQCRLAARDAGSSAAMSPDLLPMSIRGRENEAIQPRCRLTRRDVASICEPTGSRLRE
jgi:hypothetical protein